MTDWNDINQQLTKTKQLLGEACVEIAKWKSRYERTQGRVAMLERKLHAIEDENRKKGILTMPVGKVKA